MKQRITWLVWAVLFILCMWLGLLGQPGGVGSVFYLLAALIFFIPGVLLLYWGITEGNRKQVLGVRIAAICSLALTAVLLIANFCSVLLSEAAGYALYVILAVVSTPMVCCGYWVLSLFLWACLFFATLPLKKRS